jgi:hypothetical protein
VLQNTADCNVDRECYHNFELCQIYGLIINQPDDAKMPEYLNNRFPSLA